jgi:hypothetical protein
LTQKATRHSFSCEPISGGVALEAAVVAGSDWLDLKMQLAGFESDPF